MVTTQQIESKEETEDGLYALISNDPSFKEYKTTFTEGVRSMYAEYTGCDFEGHSGFLLNDEANWDTWRTFKMIFNETGGWEFEIMNGGVAELMADNDKIEIDRTFKCKVHRGDEFIILDGVKKLFSSMELLEHYIREKRLHDNTSREMYYIDKEGKHKRTVSLAYSAGEPVFLRDLVLDQGVVATIRTICNSVFSNDKVRGFDGKFLARKAGILVYGPPGNGKTSLGKAISNEYDCSLYVVDGSVESRPIEELVNEIASKSRAVVLFEEFDKILKQEDKVARIQTLLDGVGDMDGVVFVANTNEIHSIPEAIADRPGRFTVRAEFENPTKEQRAEFFNTRMPEDVKQELFDEILEETKDFSFDKCREVISRGSSYHYIDKMSEANALKRALQEIKDEFTTITKRRRGELI